MTRLPFVDPLTDDVLLSSGSTTNMRPPQARGFGSTLSMSLARMDQIQQGWRQHRACLSGLTTGRISSLSTSKRLRIGLMYPQHSIQFGPMELICTLWQILVCGQEQFQFQARLKWSADGSEIWFNPGVSVVRIKADGTSISVLEKRYFTGSTIRTAFSPDGSTLAVQVVETGPGLSEEDDKDVVLFVMDPDGSNPREVFRRALGGKLNWGGSLPTDNLIEWKLTQYTPTQEQDAQTTAIAG